MSQFSVPYPLIVIFRKGIISYYRDTARGKGRKGKATSVGVICEGMEKVRRKMGIRGDMRANLGWEAASIGPALVGRGCREKYEREESKAGGNSRLKTPLSSRELNSNVRVLRGRDERRRWENAERRRQMCAHF